MHKNLLISLTLALPAFVLAAQPKVAAHPSNPAFARVGKPVQASTWPDAAAVLRTNPVASVVVPQPPAASLAELPADTRALVEQVYVGQTPCEQGAFVTVTADAQKPGYFWVQLRQQRFHMAPVPTSTGAVRLEDAQAGMVWLQLANKSMLMNQKQGRRLVDACLNPTQLATLETMRREKRPTLFDEIGAPAGAVAMKY